MTKTVLVKREHYRPGRTTGVAEWARPAWWAALFAGAAAAGVYLVSLGVVIASVLGWAVTAGGVAGGIVLYLRLRTYPITEMVDIQEYMPVSDGERRIPLRANGHLSLEPVVKGIFSQAEFVSMSKQAAETGRLTRSPHGFSGERYQVAYEWLLERGYIGRDSGRYVWTAAGLAWLEIPPPRQIFGRYASGDDDDRDGAA